MRYAIISKGLTISQLQDEVKRHGGRNIKVTPLMKQVFCELDGAGLAKLKSTPGLVVKTLGKVAADVQAPAVRVPTVVPPVGVFYTANQLMQACGFYALRDMFTPALTGVGSTIVILDSGIRKTHESLAGKVVYEANFTSSPTVSDVFCHGTGVAYVAAGGVHGEDAGVAPGASLWNIKVLEDDGTGSEENVVLGLEHVMEMREKAMEEGLSMHDPMRPSLINISLGGPDTGDPDSPMRVACQECAKLGMAPSASAGNDGPASSTITSPACDPMVIAIGALTAEPFSVWEKSSRGPTKEGLTKPDFCCYGVNVRLAGAGSDTEYKIKSGTSFANPMLTGLAALAIELPMRWGEEFMPEPNCVQMVIDCCMKPQGVAAEQDNSYGWGMPWGEDLVSYFAPPIIDLSQVIGVVIGIGMLGMMGSTMAKALREEG